MRRVEISDLVVADIMRQWPDTIGVFIAFNLHCIGCPIGVFHTLTDAADEHGTPLEELTAAVGDAIALSETTGGLARARRR
jgi:hybrid cluster-associated redox disulfide protein